MVSTLASRQRDPGSNPRAARKSCEVYPGLGTLQPQWNPYPTLTPPSVQSVALSMVRQYGVGYERGGKVPWRLAQKGWDDQGW